MTEQYRIKTFGQVAITEGGVIISGFVVSGNKLDGDDPLHFKWPASALDFLRREAIAWAHTRLDVELSGKTGA